MSTVNPTEVNAFTAQAHTWWDETGPFKPLHKLNPVRLSFLRREILKHFKLEVDTPAPFKNLNILDVGCGGGLVAEPLARLGANVTGIDAGPANIEIASKHALNMGLDIDYRCTTAEDLAASSPNSFDVVTALEIVEHVADAPLFLKTCCDLVKPGGLLFLSTLNRTVKSFALGIIAAEYILKWVPKGTHTWHQFFEPFELQQHLSSNKLTLKVLQGLSYNPWRNVWSLSDDLDVNYILCARKEGTSS